MVELKLSVTSVNTIRGICHWFAYIMPLPGDRRCAISVEHIAEPQRHEGGGQGNSIPCPFLQQARARDGCTHRSARGAVGTLGAGGPGFRARTGDMPHPEARMTPTRARGKSWEVAPRSHGEDVAARMRTEMPPSSRWAKAPVAGCTCSKRSVPPSPSPSRVRA